MKFRTLRADEIECRVNSISDKGCQLLLYKDARADMILLDECVGAECWQRKHEVVNGNLFCNVGINIDGEWVWKQDVGVESNTEAQKGQASDAFKRACVNWGIGRELYTSPFIWIGKDGVNLETRNGKTTTYDKFSVKSITYDENRNISSLCIYNTKKKQVVFSFGERTAPIKETSTQDDLIDEAKLRTRVIKYINDCNMSQDNISKLCKVYKVEKLEDMSAEKCKNYIEFLKKGGIEI